MKTTLHGRAERGYVGIFLVLIVLTAVTVGVAYLDLGPLNPIAALAIAVTKASLVLLYFMHLRHSGRLVAIYAVGGFFWLGILVVITLSEVVERPRPRVADPLTPVASSPP
jgi:cytochrome c oxidase subunit IV